MNARELNEHHRLAGLWAAGVATSKQIARCRELDRQAKAEAPRLEPERAICLQASCRNTAEALAAERALSDRLAEALTETLNVLAGISPALRDDAALAALSAYDSARKER